MEETLCLSQWLKKIVHHPKDLFSESWLSKLSNRNRSNTNLFHNYTDDNDMVDDSSISQIKIKRYLNKYHDLIKNRGGNNLSIPKFHLILHFVRNICRLGSLPQYDGSTLESHAKYLSKSPGLRTNMHHKSISIQTAVRYHEDLTILECERLYHRNRNIQSNYSYFNKDPISSKINCDDQNPGVIGGSRFDLTLKIMEPNSGMMKCNVEWKRTVSISRINDKILHLLTHWLWFNPTGGCITRESVCHGFTEYKLNGIIYRAHTSYRYEFAKYYWDYFKMEEYSSPIIGQIIMFLDLSGCTFLSEDEALISFGQKPIIPIEKIVLSPSQHASIQKEGSLKNYISQHHVWAFIKSAKIKKPKLSRIVHQFDLEMDTFRMIPIEFIKFPVLALKDTLDSDHIVETASCFIIESPNRWSEHF